MAAPLCPSLASLKAPSSQRGVDPLLHHPPRAALLYHPPTYSRLPPTSPRTMKSVCGSSEVVMAGVGVRERPLAWGTLGSPLSLLVGPLEVLLAKFSRILSCVCMVCAYACQAAGGQTRQVNVTTNPEFWPRRKSRPNECYSRWIDYARCLCLSKRTGDYARCLCLSKRTGCTVVLWQQESRSIRSYTRWLQYDKRDSR